MAPRITSDSSMKGPDPSCPACQGSGWVRTYVIHTTDPNLPGGQNDWLPCHHCMQTAPTGSAMPSSRVFARAKLLLVMIFVIVPIGLILLLQSDWVAGLFSTSTSDTIASVYDSQAIWVGEAQCADGVHPLIVESTMVPAMGESLSVVILTSGADPEEVLAQGAERTKATLEAMDDEALERFKDVAVVIPGHLPENAISAAVTLWGGGDASDAVYQRPGDVTGLQKRFAPRTVTATFDKDEGTIAGEFSGGRCSGFTGVQ